MQVYVYVSPVAAVRAGRAQSGLIPVEVSDAEMSALGAEQRELLASCAGLGSAPEPRDRDKCAGGSGPGISEPTPAALAGWLTARVEERAQAAAAMVAEEAAVTARVLAIALDDDRTFFASRLDAERPHVYAGGYTYDPGAIAHATEVLTARAERSAERNAAQGLAAVEAAERLSDEDLPGYRFSLYGDGEKGGYNDFAYSPWPRRRALVERIDRLVAAKVVEEEAAASRKRQALSTAISDWGTESQRRRQQEGLLSEEEALRLVRDHVFAALSALPRYARMDSDDVRHSEECSEAKVTFRVAPAEAISDAQYAALARVRAAAPEGAAIELRSHTAHCGCESDAVERVSALVTLDWHGYRLSREYALD